LRFPTKSTNTERTTARASVERRHRVDSFIRLLPRSSTHLLLAENHGTKGGALFRQFRQSPGGGYSWISELPHPASWMGARQKATATGRCTQFSTPRAVRARSNSIACQAACAVNVATSAGTPTIFSRARATRSCCQRRRGIHRLTPRAQTMSWVRTRTFVREVLAVLGRAPQSQVGLQL
jgi:hypothetical protein